MINMALPTIIDLGQERGCDLTDKSLANALDEADSLSFMRAEFRYPKNRNLPPIDLNVVDGEEECVYFCGNSLGLQPKNTNVIVQEELDNWSERGVFGHFTGERPWMPFDELVIDKMAKVVGAEPIEIAVMNSLTTNLHLLMVSFYQPTKTKYKVLLEDKAFPSDHFAVESQIKFHGYDPEKAMILVKPREGEDLLRTEDIIELIEKEGDCLALILFPGMQYYTGQFFDMEAITKAGHQKGCYVGFDLAHAVGNVEMDLHDWNVDFACWCTYKYLNSGPGCVGGCFIHEKHAYNFDLPRFTGWWGHQKSTRFRMENELSLSPGAAGYRLSNVPILSMCCVLASLNLFEQVGMKKLREKSKLLTGYLEMLIKECYGAKETKEMNGPKDTNDDETPSKLKRSTSVQVSVISPADPEQRGCQLSLRFSIPVKKVIEEIEKRGVVCDVRHPDVIRVAPAPLYNSFNDVWRFMHKLDEALKAAQEEL